MGRYRDISIKKREDGVRRLKTPVYPELGNQRTAKVIRAREGDRLDSLAKRYYDDATLWWVIAQANNLGKGSYYIPAGMEVVIPSSAADAQTKINSLNNNRR